MPVPRAVTTSVLLLCLALAGCAPAGEDDPGTAAPATAEDPAGSEPTTSGSDGDTDPTPVALSRQRFDLPDLECEELVPFLGPHAIGLDLVRNNSDEDEITCDWESTDLNIDITKVVGVSIAVSEGDVPPVDNPLAGKNLITSQPERLAPLGGVLYWSDAGVMPGGTGIVHLPGLTISVGGHGMKEGTGMQSEHVVDFALAVVGW